MPAKVTPTTVTLRQLVNLSPNATPSAKQCCCYCFKVLFRDTELGLLAVFDVLAVRCRNETQERKSCRNSILCKSIPEPKSVKRSFTCTYSTTQPIPALEKRSTLYLDSSRSGSYNFSFLRIYFSTQLPPLIHLYIHLCGVCAVWSSKISGLNRWDHKGKHWHKRLIDRLLIVSEFQNSQPANLLALLANCCSQELSCSFSFSFFHQHTSWHSFSLPF